MRSSELSFETSAPEAISAQATAKPETAPSAMSLSQRLILPSASLASSAAAETSTASPRRKFSRSTPFFRSPASSPRVSQSAHALSAS